MIQLLGIWAVISALIAWLTYEIGRSSLDSINKYQLQYYRLPDGSIEWGPHPELGKPTWSIETATRVSHANFEGGRLADQRQVYRSTPVGPKPYPTNVFLRHAEAMDAQARSGTWAEPGYGHVDWQDHHQAAAKWGTASHVRWHWPVFWRWIWSATSNGFLATAILLVVVQAFSWFAACVREELAAIARRRPRPKICHRCGYSRVGLPEHNPCPECGKLPPPTSAVAEPTSSPSASPSASPTRSPASSPAGPR